MGEEASQGSFISAIATEPVSRDRREIPAPNAGNPVERKRGVGKRPLALGKSVDIVVEVDHQYSVIRMRAKFCPLEKNRWKAFRELPVPPCAR
jgi:hypothetical protein